MYMWLILFEGVCFMFYHTPTKRSMLRRYMYTESLACRQMLVFIASDAVRLFICKEYNVEWFSGLFFQFILMLYCSIFYLVHDVATISPSYNC